MFRIFIAFVFLAILWFQGIKPIVSDYYLSKSNLEKALAWNPRDSLLQLKSGRIMEVIDTNNGDVTQYSLWYGLGIAMLRQGGRNAAMSAFKKALYYYPDYEPAKRLMAELNK